MKNSIVKSYDVSQFTLKEVSEGVRVLMFLNDIYSYFYKKEDFQIDMKDGEIDIFIKHDLVRSYKLELYERSYYDIKDVHIFTNKINEEDFFSNINYFNKKFQGIEYDYECNTYFSYELLEDEIFGLSSKANYHRCESLDIKRFKKLLPEINILKFTKFIIQFENKIELNNRNKKEILELQERNKSLKDNDNFTDYEKETTIKRNNDRIEILKKEIL